MLDTILKSKPKMKIKHLWLLLSSDWIAVWQSHMLHVEDLPMHDYYKAASRCSQKVKKIYSYK